jgi:hypothetical protein
LRIEQLQLDALAGRVLAAVADRVQRPVRVRCLSRYLSRQVTERVLRHVRRQLFFRIRN